jgi:hypothetical protein
MVAMLISYLSDACLLQVLVVVWVQALPLVSPPKEQFELELLQVWQGQEPLLAKVLQQR